MATLAEVQAAVNAWMVPLYLKAALRVMRILNKTWGVS